MGVSGGGGRILVKTVYCKLHISGNT